MRNCSKTKQKRLAKLVLAALMCTGGGLYNLSTDVLAASYVVNGTVEHEGNTSSFSGTSFTPGHADYAYGNEIFAVSYPTTSADNFTVTITSPTSYRLFGAAATTRGSASGNTLTITGDSTTITQMVYGGYVYGDSNPSPTGTANNNTVNINSGTINSVTGGQVGGGYYAVSGDANDNTVTISGGTVTGYIYGGATSDGEASGNTVTIQNDAELDSNARIYGGFTMNGAANNNTVNILKAVTVKHILGGEGTSATGNTLNIAAKGVTVGDEGVVGFQNMNFYLPSDIASGDTMLTINSSATDLTGVTIGTAAQTGVNLNQGDTVTLLSNTNGFTGTAATTTLTTAPTATSLTLDTSYKFAINQGDTAVTATVTDKTESSTESSMERAKSLVETRAATTTFINAGADMLSSQGFMQAANAVALEAAEQTTSGAAGVPSVSTFTPFAAMGGSSMRAQSGSYVDTKGFGLNVGFAREISNAQGKLLFGPVVEYGGGSYDSYLEDAAGTHGEGGAHYYGLGIMARQVNHDGLYYEGSLRGGRVNSDYKTTMDTLGKVNYDSSSNYFAAHLGVGKAFSIGNGNTLDGYLKYFYSHQAGDTTTIHIENAADERGSFDAVDSHRLRIGARLTHKVNDRNSFYGGLAYQYEFGGEARAHFSSGGNVPSPSVKGGSGMLELGWQVKPGGPVTIDLGMTGWAGKQRGGSIQLGANWTF
ncbi:autotransporter outer membrane beta-barrel domain-containing protein [Selenomonas ruminantium]|uniref:autotransporter outer membrane beta-barrel domain-containing protein n=1 Tax=Selenomonas ruminantium TaxID=971 RepID=UPI00047DE1E2|nr:autotransporter outer membrane beta-barrel domain-containing protein [Selenomonas ruminantium]